MARVADIVAAIERRYDPSTAAEWDAVGLVCGDPDADVRHVRVAVDPVAVVVEEAIEAGAQLLFVHHPLFLGGTDSVAATSVKGRLVHRLVTNGVALYVAHTNADVATPGVSDALAAALELRHVRAIDGADPPGLGRIGELPVAMTLREFVEKAAQALPATVWGVRAAGDPDRLIGTVAVAGGSCGELAEAAAAAGADVLLTSDLKHHRTSEAVANYGIGLVDAAHWATEQPWVASAAALLAADLRQVGTTVEVTPSTIVTDPWTLHAPHTHSPEEL